MLKIFREPTVAGKLEILLREAQMNATASRIKQEEHEVLQAYHRSQAAMYQRRAVWLKEELQKLVDEPKHLYPAAPPRPGEFFYDVIEKGGV